MSNSCRK